MNTEERRTQREAGAVMVNAMKDYCKRRRLVRGDLVIHFAECLFYLFTASPAWIENNIQQFEDLKKELDK